jgi:4-diphosphocytidyl-2-C-methyl-D-erythritol kinase
MDGAPIPFLTAQPAMHLSRYLDDVVVWAPAKVNLHLEVLGKRPDGFHAIETLMVTVGLYDTLVFRDDATGDVQLACSDPTLSVGADNLVVRAARLLQERAGCVRGCRMRLVKRIPMAAGLAGGSTDAAATLLGLNQLWQLGLTQSELARLSAELGSDVPFFFHAPAAWCSGRGEIVAAAPAGGRLDLVLVCPSFGMPTAQVYRGVAVPEQPQNGAAIRAALGRGDVAEVGRLLFNRLAESAARLDARIADYYKRLAALAPAGQLMSGSGSSLFALCRSPSEAERITTALRDGTGADLFRVFAVRGCV